MSWAGQGARHGPSPGLWLWGQRVPCREGLVRSHSGVPVWGRTGWESGTGMSGGIQRARAFPEKGQPPTTQEQTAPPPHRKATYLGPPRCWEARHKQEILASPPSTAGSKRAGSSGKEASTSLLPG